MKELLMTFLLSSPAFEHMGEIPVQYTCNGADISPPLGWQGHPEHTRSFVLIVDDPDAPDPAAPQMVWVHWVLYNLSPQTTHLDEGIGANNLPANALQGVNDWKQVGYRGPCPPVGRHRYFFKLYALDTVLPELSSPTKAEVEAAMAGHVIAETQLIGTYQQ